MSDSRTVLVTGGAGFIGSHVVRALRQEGVQVRVFDSLVSGSRENVPEEISFIEADIRDKEALQRAMEGVTQVVHLAALVSVPASIEDPLLTHEVNSVGTENVLEAARAAGVQRIVYASSAAVYGDAPELPKRENMELHPQSPYAFSKVENERLARTYAETHALSSAGLRFFNVYGPGQKGNHPYASVVPRFIEALRAGKQVEVFGDGTQTRDFIHVRDVARAITIALTKDSTGASVFNIASGTETSLNQLIHIIGEVRGEAIAPVLKPGRAGDIQKSVADVSAAKEALGFIASVPLTEGIGELLV